ncbi:chorismate synthase [Wolbachia endosymbiont of Brugia malayi]|uniref:DnaA ATPase domain-containing protein n=1 Tax=unclassified Wolbachia TaxID=2640676 RepID=UPI00004C94E6|nr:MULTISPECIES: DnaA/Hda family protein [unclassified Wolbachia]AAW71319.1 Possible ATPase involved in DNA replication initiation, DnaA paralog [Wolbachia endosymbiont strain TRS of Brugia malayi]QCB61511.1 chorismate synthase [Wolbachia endosymbiont of Brugia malayi]QIT36555.1 bacterial dnaA family protein [Wolbachia endosymbiont of Brugia pahangi]
MQLNLFNNNQVDYSRQNYIILDENKHIYNAVINDLSWKYLFLFGPKGSGKTHLAHIWQSINNAIFINVNNFISEIRYSNAFILEDVQDIQDEATLLHCYNYMKENNKRLLITSSTSPKRLNFKLKDLSSRILSTISAKIPSASEELLRIMLIKRFSDKQLKVDLKVINYILARIERSFCSINRIIEKIDNGSMGSNVTIPFVSTLLKRDTT